MVKLLLFQALLYFLLTPLLMVCTVSHVHNRNMNHAQPFHRAHNNISA